ncbi:MAG: RluA family pseudouridine synthase [Treponema sp.]|jgi:23S rRNA pseudouridine955/2504/2580 synthase|nr:RluA family pseudouridine synthase [Treponema sp.]
MELETGNDDAGRRLDRILRKALPEYPLSLIHRLLRQGQVLVGGKPAQGDKRIPAGLVINIAALPPVSRTPFRQLPPAKRRLPPLLWQGAGLLVLNKPAGLAVHGPDSLDILVQAHLADKLAPSLAFRPGPLHRLDKPTSGLIVFSTSIEGARRFSALLRERQLQKYYLALVEGRLDTDAVWEDTLIRDSSAKKTRSAGQDSAAGGKTALTRVRPLAANAAYTLLLAEIATGRTHQIRAHAAAHRHPLAGDIKYGGHATDGVKRRGGNFFLHAWKLKFGKSAKGFPPLIIAPPPESFTNQIAALFGKELVKKLHLSGPVSKLQF